MHYPRAVPLDIAWAPRQPGPTGGSDASRARREPRRVRRVDRGGCDLHRPIAWLTKVYRSASSIGHV
jgi:hypothetical protein